jgi:hypothetical protein
MDSRQSRSSYKGLESLGEQTSPRSADAFPSNAELFRRSLYGPSERRPRLQELKESRNTQVPLWLTEAREGFRRFDRSYQNGDVHWKHFLTQTKNGKELQAVFLGIKPLMSIYPGEIHDERMVGMIHHHAKKDFFVLDRRPMGGQLTLFSEKNVDLVLRAHPEYFSTYDSASSVYSYLSELGRQPVTQMPEHLDIQRGLLHGFSLHASVQFAKYKDNLMEVADLYERLPVNTEEKRLLQRYLGEDELRTRDYSSINEFRQIYQIAMRQCLDAHLPLMPEDAKQYIVNLRYINTPGMLYASDCPTSTEDQTLIQRALDTFRFSGMDNYLRYIIWR